MAAPWSIHCNLWKTLILIGVYLLLFAGLGSGRARAQSNLPTIKQVGILPLYWQGQFPDGHPFRPQQKLLEQSFPKLVRESKRFAFTNDVITADLWATPEGRRELAEQFEIDALVSLTISSQGDFMLWTTRLLGPAMQNYLSESERVPYSWFLASGQLDIEERLRKLIYRTLNRYPIDVFVTSIQGRYLTLSSGSLQHVFEGDKLTFYETRLKSQHPVDGSWLDFDRKLLGTAQIVQSQEQSSIAMITALSYENAIGVGAGARVEGIATRRAFQQRPAMEQRYVALNPGSPLVEPLTEKPKQETVPPITPPPARQTQNKTGTEEGPPPIAPSELTEPTPTPQPNPVTPPPRDEGIQDEWLPVAFRELRVFAEHESFQFSGVAKTESQMPPYLINRAGVQGIQDVDETLQVWYGADINFGSTRKGSSFGFELGAELLYRVEALNSTLPSLDRILAGVLVQMESLGVNKETFGGWNAFFLIPGVHLQGAYHLVDWAQTVDYDLGLRFYPFSSGSAGVASRNRDLDGGFAYEVEAQALRRGRSQEWEWGGLFAYRSGSWDLSRGTLNQERLRIGLTGRLRL
jgi:hypothetical protein